MTDEVQHLVLEHLKAIGADLAYLRRDVRDVKVRLSSVENQVAQMHKSFAFLHQDLAGVHARLASRSNHVEHIERRLELREMI